MQDIEWPVEGWGAPGTPFNNKLLFKRALNALRRECGTNADTSPLFDLTSTRGQKLYQQCSFTGPPPRDD